MGTVNIGIIGIGTVGGGVVRLLEKHHNDYLRKLGLDLKIARVCARTPARAQNLGVEELFTDKWQDITRDSSIDIVVELMGGTSPALEIIQDALIHKKHVVTANKALLAHEMGFLAGLAREHGVQLRCEAAVCGGIPIIEALEHALLGNEVLTIAGIVNGTTNFMLTMMEQQGASFEEALATAQKLGYAEADPTADVDGLDAAAKATILACIGFGTRVARTDLSVIEGIRGVSLSDVQLAAQLGYRIKLLAVVRKTSTGIDVRVHPAMIPTDHMLARVDGVNNAVYVVGDAVGETMFFGAGAGSFPTASAVMGDILALAAPLASGAAPLPETEPFGRVLPIRPASSVHNRYYLRLSVDDKPGMLAQVAACLASYGTSLQQVIQHRAAHDGTAEIVLVTHITQHESICQALEELKAADGVSAINAVIRVEDVQAWCRDAIGADERV